MADTDRREAPLPADSAARRSSRPPGRSCSTRCSPRPTWTLVLSESEDGGARPGGPLLPDLPLGRRCCPGSAVLLLSISQIRRSLVPLGELHEGTRRIAQRDFASRVTVTQPRRVRGAGRRRSTRWPCSSAASSRRSSTAAELDRAVLSATDVASIVDTLLARTRDVFPCHLVGVTLVAPDGGKSLSGVVYDYCDDAAALGARRSPLGGRAGPARRPGSDRGGRCRAATHPAYLGPLLRLGARVGPRAAAPLPAAAGRHPAPRATAAPKAPGRTSGCSSAGWPTRSRWRWPTRGCWSR